ncbi:MAG: DNA polymerase III subunit gamma/tau [Oligoflexia bacterium]|nr:DNA polymerase III subunit gamma/tau [Oligoflexia bacterium]
MSYLVLARKYRPDSFSTVEGQEHVTRTLANAIKRNKVAHAYIFSGPRGVGKTSISRIFSKALNCVKGPTAEPCLECSNCREIAAGTSLAVREIDGASHNSVDNVRELIDSFRALPPPGYKYKIYIIDEVHMLSTSAFNALLKSLEEPPPNTVFILATTELHKIPETVISRCQQFDLRALGVEEIERCLAQIVKSEKLKIEPEALSMIARLADGSMRDAQTLLDRVQSFCEGAITAQDASRALGSVERRTLHALSLAILQRDSEKALSLIADTFSTGVDPSLFLREYAAHWRELLLAHLGGQAALKELRLSAAEQKDLEKLLAAAKQQDMQDLVDLAIDGADKALRSAFPKYALESLVVRMSTREPVQTMQALMDKFTAFLQGAARPDPIKPSSGGGSGGGGGHVIASRPSTSVSSTATPARSAGSAALVTQPTATTDSAMQPLQWGNFVVFAAQKVSRLTSEQLRRLSVEVFAAGRLQARGPEFSLQYLNGKDIKAKIAVALEEFSGIKPWAIEFSILEAAGEAAPGSLLEREQAKKRQNEEEKKKSAANHPKIKSLQRAFPGSTIEAIKIRE